MQLLDSRQNKKYIQRPRGDQDGNPSYGLANDFGGLPLQCAQAVPVIGGLPQQLDNVR